MIPYSSILELLPQAPPMLMIDRVVNYSRMEKIIAEKCVSGLDPYFAGHFKGGVKIVPGFLIAEGIAQCALLLAKLSSEGSSVQTGEYLMISAKISFRSKVEPGQVIRYEVELEHFDEGSAAYTGVASVDGKTVVKAQCTSIFRRFAGEEST